MKVKILGGDNKLIYLDENNDFVSQGGEGKIYKKNNLIYKIFIDSNSMTPINKINELCKMNSQYILNPINILLNEKNKQIGYTMNYISNSLPICKLFSNEFRKKNKIEIDSDMNIIEHITKITKDEIHKNNCLIVDTNEFNFLISEIDDFKKAYFIDTNSYQTPSYPATAIMLNIRDWSVGNNFNTLSDWYSLGILFFQILTGIHPFRGNHPKYTKEKYGDNILKQRMIDNISVFDKNVSLPNKIRDFNNIPKNYLNWFINIFQNGKRLNPPEFGGNIIVLPIITKEIFGSNNFIIDLFKEFDSDIIFSRISNGNMVVKTQNKIYFNSLSFNVNKEGYKYKNDIDIIFSKNNFYPILIKLENNILKIKDIKNDIILQEFIGEKYFVYENRIFLKNEENLYEIIIEELGNKLLPHVLVTHQIMPNSSNFLTNLIYQNILGKPFFTIPLNKSIETISIKELENYSIIDGKYDNNILVIIGHKNGKYDRFTFIKNNDKFNLIDLENDISDLNINFTTLDNGLCLFMKEDGLNIFNGSKKLKIHDNSLDDNCILCKNNLQAMFYKDNKLYNFKMKK